MSTVKPNGTQKRWQSYPSSPTLSTRVRAMGSAALELIELQSRLALLEARSAVTRTTPALAGIGIGVALLLGAMPVLIVCIADGLALVLPLSALAARSLVTGILIVIGLVLVRWAVARLNSLTTEFRSTFAELARTLEWLRQNSSRDID